MNTAAELTRITAALQRLRPLERLQSVMIFGNGKSCAVFTTGTLRFEFFAQIEALIEYQQALRQGLDGEGI